MEILKSFSLILEEKKLLRIGRVGLTSPTILDLMGMWLVFSIMVAPILSLSSQLVYLGVHNEYVNKTITNVIMGALML